MDDKEVAKAIRENTQVQKQLVKVLMAFNETMATLGQRYLENNPNQNPLPRDLSSYPTINNERNI